MTNFGRGILTNVRETKFFTTSIRRDEKEVGKFPKVYEALPKSITHLETIGFIEPSLTINELGNVIQARSELS
jgi:hypothetical protein